MNIETSFLISRLNSWMWKVVKTWKVCKITFIESWRHPVRRRFKLFLICRLLIIIHHKYIYFKGRVWITAVHFSFHHKRVSPWKYVAYCSVSTRRHSHFSLKLEYVSNWYFLFRLENLSIKIWNLDILRPKMYWLVSYLDQFFTKK